MKLTDQGHDFGLQFCVALAALDLLAGDHPLALPGALELGNNHRLVELRDCAEYLPDQFRCRRVVEEGLRAVGSDQLDAKGLQLRKANLLHHEVAREPAGGLDDDGASAIAGDVGEHGYEAGARLDVVSTAHCCVVELAHKLEPSTLGECCDG